MWTSHAIFTTYLKPCIFGRITSDIWGPHFPHSHVAKEGTCIQIQDESWWPTIPGHPISRDNGHFTWSGQWGMRAHVPGMEASEKAMMKEMQRKICSLLSSKADVLACDICSSAAVLHTWRGFAWGQCSRLRVTNQEGGKSPIFDAGEKLSQPPLEPPCTSRLGFVRW